MAVLYVNFRLIEPIEEKKSLHEDVVHILPRYELVSVIHLTVFGSFCRTSLTTPLYVSLSVKPTKWANFKLKVFLLKPVVDGTNQMLVI